jgi:hypothetical protein
MCHVVSIDRVFPEKNISRKKEYFQKKKDGFPIAKFEKPPLSAPATSPAWSASDLHTNCALPSPWEPT